MADELSQTSKISPNDLLQLWWRRTRVNGHVRLQIDISRSLRSPKKHSKMGSFQRGGNFVIALRPSIIRASCKYNLVLYIISLSVHLSSKHPCVSATKQPCKHYCARKTREKITVFRDIVNFGANIFLERLDENIIFGDFEKSMHWILA